MQEALSDLRARSNGRWRRCRRRPGRRWPPSSSGSAIARACRSQVEWPRRRGVPADLEPLAQSVLAEALRNVAKHADAVARSRSRSRATRTRSRSRSATTASATAPAAPGWACGWPRSRRSSTAASSSSARPTRLLAGPAGHTAHRGDGVSLGAGAGAGAAAAGARRRRPRRRALGLPGAAGRAAVGRALPGGANRRRGAGHPAVAAARCGPRRPVPGRRVGRRRVRLDPQDVAVDAGAAHLRGGTDVAGGGASRRARRGSSPRTGRPARSPRAVRMVGLRDDRVRAERRAAGAAADRARARGARPDRAPGRPTARSPSSSTCRRTRSRSTPAPLYRKLRARNRAEAVQRAQRIGLLS